MLAHQPPVIADSIPWPGAVLLLGTDLLVIDELQDFISHPAALLTSILSRTCQFNVLAVLSRQTLDQLPDRLRSDLQHGDLDICFPTGHDDTEQQAKVVATVNPFSVKHEGAGHKQRSHPALFPLPGRPRRLLDLHLRQLAAHAALRPRVGCEVRGPGADTDRRPYAGVRLRAASIEAQRVCGGFQ